MSLMRLTHRHYRLRISNRHQQKPVLDKTHATVGHGREKVPQYDHENEAVQSMGPVHSSNRAGDQSQEAAVEFDREEYTKEVLAFARPWWDGHPLLFELLSHETSWQKEFVATERQETRAAWPWQLR